MSSQIRHNFQPSQAVHGADDIITLHFQSQVNSLSVRGPQVDALIFCWRLECPTLFYYLCSWLLSCNCTGPRDLTFLRFHSTIWFCFLLASDWSGDWKWANGNLVLVNQVSFCSTALTSTGRVRSTFKLLLHYPLSKQCTMSINLYDIKNFLRNYLRKNLENTENRTRGRGARSKNAIHCAMRPLIPSPSKKQVFGSVAHICRKLVWRSPELFFPCSAELLLISRSDEPKKSAPKKFRKVSKEKKKLQR